MHDWRSRLVCAPTRVRAGGAGALCGGAYGATCGVCAPCACVALTGRCGTCVTLGVCCRCVAPLGRRVGLLGRHTWGLRPMLLIQLSVALWHDKGAHPDA